MVTGRERIIGGIMNKNYCCPDIIWEQDRDFLKDTEEKMKAQDLLESLNEEFNAAAKKAATQTEETEEERQLRQKRNELAMNFLPLIRRTASGYAYRDDLFDKTLFDDLCQEGWLITVRLLEGHEQDSCEEIAAFLKYELRPRVRHLAFKIRFARELSYDKEDSEIAYTVEDTDSKMRVREAELKIELERRLETNEERQLVKLLLANCTEREIAARLSLSKTAAHCRIMRLREKLAPFKQMLLEGC